MISREDLSVYPIGRQAMFHRFKIEASDSRARNGFQP